MVKKIVKLYYADLPNMGDQLNVLIFRDIFGMEVERHTVLTAEVSGIGSGLGNFMWSDRFPQKVLQRLAGISQRPVTIWGSGFLFESGAHAGGTDKAFFRKNIAFAAVEAS